MVRIRLRSSFVVIPLVIGMALAPALQGMPPTHAAPPAAEQIRQDAAARVDAYFAKLELDHQFSGAVLLAQGDNVLLSKGYGMSEWSRQIHNTASTEFPDPVTALEKFAGAAVLQLEDAGKIHDTDHICGYIPHCPTIWAPITVRELLSFTSGIHDYGNEPTPGFSLTQSYTLPQLVAWLGTLPLDYRPGTHCCSFVPTTPVEEYLVEQVSGVSFTTYLRRHFLQPFGLAHTGYFLHQPPANLQVMGYQSWQTPASAMDASGLGGMIYTTVTDFYHWQYALLTGQVLSATATTRLLTPVATFCPPQCWSMTGYTTLSTTEGYVVGTDHGMRILLHWAGPNAFGDKITYYPSAKVSLIILANQMDIQVIRSSQKALIFG